MIFGTPAHLKADLFDDLNRFFVQIGGAANVEAPEVYNGQKAGFLTGGGATTKSRVSNTRLVTINLPSFDAGCGGIDIYTGGFSFINAKELENNLKNIASNSLGYAFLLGIETVSPQIGNTMKVLEDWQDKINALNINSCETAATLVGSVWPKNSVASGHICQTMGTSDGFFQDRVAARHKCGSPGEARGQKDRVWKEAKFAGMLEGEYNIAWEVLKKSPLAGDREAMELYQTMLGTVVFSVNDDGTDAIDYFKGKGADEAFLQAMLNGGPLEVYKCTSSGNKCLHIQNTATNVKYAESLTEKINRKLVGMRDKIIRDEELEQGEVQFLGSQELPLWEFVNITAAHRGTYCSVDLKKVSEVVAMDMMLRYVRETIELAIEASQHLRRNQAFAQEVDSYIQDLRDLEQRVLDFEYRQTNRRRSHEDIVHRLEHLSEVMASRIKL